jgi:hypothetical protein
MEEGLYHKKILGTVIIVAGLLEDTRSLKGWKEE